jgi:hypothetical protein
MRAHSTEIQGVYLLMFGFYQTTGLAVLNTLARLGDYRYQETRFTDILESVVNATNRLLGEAYTESPVIMMGHADVVVSFSRTHRRKSPLVHDIQTFISSKR